MKAPQILVIALVATHLLVGARFHGTPHKSKVNFWRNLLIDAVLVALLLWGRFWA